MRATMEAAPEGTRAGEGGYLDEKTRLRLGAELRSMYNDSMDWKLPKRISELVDRLRSVELENVQAR
jgi:hypothetical protein